MLYLIEKKIDSRIEKIKFLKETNKHIYIYGEGNYANQLLPVLRNKNIKIKGMLNDQTIKDIDRKSIIICGFMPSKTCFKKASNLGFKEIINLGCLTFPLQFFSYEYIKENIHELNIFYEKLANDKSKRNLIKYINYRISGNIKDLDFIKPQYFHKELLKINKNEVYIDLGAYTGDSILDFINFTGNKYKKIFAFEPSNESFILLKNNLNNYKNIKYYNSGSWSESTNLNFLLDINNSMQDRITNDSEKHSTNKIQVYALDDIILDEKPTLLKMDIEGAEYNTLLGAKKIIKKYKPKLAIAIYHKKEDIIKIPALLLKLNPDYIFKLEFHSPLPADFILYAE